MSVPVVLGVLGFLAFWCGAVALVGRLGWMPVARRFPAARWPAAGEGASVGWQRVRVNALQYDGLMQAVLTEEGLYLRPHLALRINHPPMRIPWEAMGPPRPTFLGGVELVLDGGTRLRLRGRLAQLVLDVLASARSEPDSLEG